MDDTFRQVGDLAKSSAASSNDNSKLAATSEQPLLLAQIDTHDERSDKNMRAVRVIESFHRDIKREPSDMLHDGYWVIICESLKHSESPEHLAYFAQLNHAQEVYSALQADESLRK